MPVNHSKAIWSDKVLCRTKNWKRASYTEEVTCKRCIAIDDAMAVKSDGYD